MKSLATPIVLLTTVAAVSLSGCASTQHTHDEITALQTQMQQVRETADKAAADAAAARATAEDALRAAREAQSTASDAAATARNAQNRAQQSENKIDRMFKKAMYK